MKATFIHTFTNDSRCTVTLDFTGDKPVTTAIWHPEVDVDWKSVEVEYRDWRNRIFTTFWASLTEAEQARVLTMLAAQPL